MNNPNVCELRPARLRRRSGFRRRRCRRRRGRSWPWAAAPGWAAGRARAPPRPPAPPATGSAGGAATPLPQPPPTPSSPRGPRGPGTAAPAAATASSARGRPGPRARRRGGHLRCGRHGRRQRRRCSAGPWWPCRAAGWGLPSANRDLWGEPGWVGGKWLCSVTTHQFLVSVQGSSVWLARSLDLLLLRNTPFILY